MWWSVCENAAHGWTSQLPFSLEIIIILFLNLLSFLLSLISSMLFASNWMSSQYIQTCQNLCQLHVLEEITPSSFWPAWCPVWCWDLRSPSSGGIPLLLCFLRCHVFHVLLSWFPLSFGQSLLSGTFQSKGALEAFLRSRHLSLFLPLH